MLCSTARKYKKIVKKNFDDFLSIICNLLINNYLKRYTKKLGNFNSFLVTPSGRSLHSVSAPLSSVCLTE